MRQAVSSTTKILFAPRRRRLDTMVFFGKTVLKVVRKNGFKSYVRKGGPLYCPCSSERPRTTSLKFWKSEQSCCGRARVVFERGSCSRTRVVVERTYWGRAELLGSDESGGRTGVVDNLPSPPKFCAFSSEDQSDFLRIVRIQDSCGIVHKKPPRWPTPSRPHDGPLKSLLHKNGVTFFFFFLHSSSG